MIKQIRIHIVLLLLMYTIFIICTLVYGRGFSDDTIKVIGYYSVLVVILFLLNLVKKRVLRWLVFLIVIFIPLSYLIFVGSDHPDGTSLYVLTSAAQIDVPFLPSNLSFELNSHFENVIITYSLYFLLPLLYWYGLYSLSKLLENKFSVKFFKGTE